MPRYSGQHNCSVKFDLARCVRERFVEACAFKGVSQSEAMRLFCEVFADEVDEERAAARAGEVPHG